MDIYGPSSTRVNRAVTKKRNCHAKLEGGICLLFKSNTTFWLCTAVYLDVIMIVFAYKLQGETLINVLYLLYLRTLRLSRLKDLYHNIPPSFLYRLT